MGTILNGYSFCGSNSAIYMGSILKGKNLLSKEQIHSIKNGPHFGLALTSRKLHRKPTKLVPFVKIADSHGFVLMHLKTIIVGYLQKAVKSQIRQFHNPQMILSMNSKV